MMIYNMYMTKLFFEEQLNAESYEPFAKLREVNKLM